MSCCSAPPKEKKTAAQVAREQAEREDLLQRWRALGGGTIEMPDLRLLRIAVESAEFEAASLT